MLLPRYRGRIIDKSAPDQRLSIARWPRSTWLAAIITGLPVRMMAVAEMDKLLPRPNAERGAILVAGHVAKFVVEICGNGLKIRWPLPWPPPAWFKDSLTGQDLIVMG